MRSKQRFNRRILLYAYLFGLLLLWALFGLTAFHWSVSCAHTAPSIYRLALLLLICFGVVISLLLTLLLLLGCDFCCSGRLRMVVVLER